MLLSVALEDAGSQLWGMSCDAKWFSQKSAAFGLLFHYLFIYLFIFTYYLQLFWVFPVRVRAFSRCSERGLLCSGAGASLVSEHRH